jgi:peptide/nickel transport system permease protein
MFMENTMVREDVREEGDYTKKTATLSQARLVALRFFRHKLAVAGIAILVFLYISALCAPFFSLNDPHRFFDRYLYCPPQSIRFWDDAGFSIQPFYYPLKTERDMRTLELKHVPDTSIRIPVKIFARGFEYKLFGFFKTDIHFLQGNGENPLFLMGTDKMGRDLYARNLYAGRISLTVGLVGVAITFILGCILGGISGFYGGNTDLAIQRVIEFLMAIPTLPLWMALSAALPRQWSELQRYFSITLILAVAGWTGLARVVRGKILSIKSEDYVTAAMLSGAPDRNIILSHLLPGFAGYLIVNITLSIPSMILGETALSFLGLGLQAPTISWGVLLGEAQSVKVIAMNPWIMIPGLSVVLTVLAYNFVGDGLRDALDPHRGN